MPNHPVVASLLRSIDDAYDATGKIVFAFAIHSWHLRGLATKQCATGRSAR